MQMITFYFKINQIYLCTDGKISSIQLYTKPYGQVVHINIPPEKGFVTDNRKIKHETHPSIGKWNYQTKMAIFISCIS